MESSTKTLYWSSLIIIILSSIFTILIPQIIPNISEICLILLFPSYFITIILLIYTNLKILHQIYAQEGLTENKMEFKIYRQGYINFRQYGVDYISLKKVTIRLIIANTIFFLVIGMIAVIVVPWLFFIYFLFAILINIPLLIVVINFKKMK